MKICDKKDCTGCGACYVACPTDAITMKEDEKGFLNPVIDLDKCINCSLCTKVCPSLNLTNKSSKENSCYSCFNKNVDERLSSSSGGIFTLIAKEIFNVGGVVYGVRFADTFDSALHVRTTNINDFEVLKGSKYLQSDTGETFKQVKEDLINGLKVLYSGTPCQIAGLKNYLRKDYDGLVTVDLVCHGVPSPKIFRDYVQAIKNQYELSDIISFSHRSKDKGWMNSCTKIVDVNNKTYLELNTIDPYFCTFNKELFLRDCCHECKYNTTDRVSDITIADFWGYVPSSYKVRDDNKGLSVALVNTDLGQNIFDKISNQIVYKKEDIKLAINGNQSLVKSWPKSEKSDEFWNRIFNNEDIIDVMKDYYKPTVRNIEGKGKRFIKDSMIILIPRSVKNMIKKVLGR